MVLFVICLHQPKCDMIIIFDTLWACCGLAAPPPLWWSGWPPLLFQGIRDKLRLVHPCSRKLDVTFSFHKWSEMAKPKHNIIYVNHSNYWITKIMNYSE